MADTGKVNIHGKQYETVASRVQRFREKYPNHTLKTKIEWRDETEVVMRASILDTEGRLIATGHAEEQRQSSTINRTSALENAETSAIGRALAAFGMAGTEYASADEVAAAISQRTQQTSSKPAVGTAEPVKEPLATPTQKARIKAYLTALGIAVQDMPEHLEAKYGIIPGEPMLYADAEMLIEELAP